MPTSCVGPRRLQRSRFTTPLRQPRVTPQNCPLLSRCISAPTSGWTRSADLSVVRAGPDRLGWFYGPRGLPLPGMGAATVIWTSSAGNVSASLAGLGQVTQRAGDLLTIPRLDVFTVDALLGTTGVETACSVVDLRRYADVGGRGQCAGRGGIGTVTQWQVAQPWERLLPPKIAVALVDETGYRWAQTDDAMAIAYQGWQAGQSVYSGHAAGSAGGYSSRRLSGRREYLRRPRRARWVWR